MTTTFCAGLESNHNIYAMSTDIFIYFSVESNTLKQHKNRYNYSFQAGF